MAMGGQEGVRTEKVGTLSGGVENRPRIPLNSWPHLVDTAAARWLEHGEVTARVSQHMPASQKAGNM